MGIRVAWVCEAVVAWVFGFLKTAVLARSAILVKIDLAGIVHELPSLHDPQNPQDKPDSESNNNRRNAGREQDGQCLSELIAQIICFLRFLIVHRPYPFFQDSVGYAHNAFDFRNG